MKWQSILLRLGLVLAIGRPSCLATASSSCINGGTTTTTNPSTTPMMLAENKRSRKIAPASSSAAFAMPLPAALGPGGVSKYALAHSSPWTGMALTTMTACPNTSHQFGIGLQRREVGLSGSRRMARNVSFLHISSSSATPLKATSDDGDESSSSVPADEKDETSSSGESGGTVSTIAAAADPAPTKTSPLSPEDRSLVLQILSEIGKASSSSTSSSTEEGGGAAYDESVGEQIMLQYLSILSTNLVMTLRNAASGVFFDDEEVMDDDKGNGNVAVASREELTKLGQTLGTVLDERLENAKSLLADLLSAGEIRKLDGAIGRAAKDGKLDMAFFTVLGMNLRDAAESEAVASAANDETTAAVTEEEDGTATFANSRYQILQHVNTRCQEEVEKIVSPGMGLLNKLLRTEQASIRSNQIRHYLGPQKSTISTPDGKEVELQGGGKALVAPDEFISALSNTVTQIRQVQRAGGTDQVTAANLVESCRQVAKEARLVIGDEYGVDSDTLKAFEERLQPVFRPGSTNEEDRGGDDKYKP